MARMTLGDVNGMRQKVAMLARDTEAFSTAYLKEFLAEGNAYCMAKLKTHFTMPVTASECDAMLVDLVEMWGATRAIESSAADNGDTMQTVVTWQARVNRSLTDAKRGPSDPKAIDLGLTAKAAPSAATAQVRGSETDKAAWSDLDSEENWDDLTSKTSDADKSLGTNSKWSS